MFLFHFWTQLLILFFFFLFSPFFYFILFFFCTNFVHFCHSSSFSFFFSLLFIHLYEFYPEFPICKCTHAVVDQGPESLTFVLGNVLTHILEL